MRCGPQVVNIQLGNYLELDPLINSDLSSFGVSISKIVSGNIGVSINRPVWRDQAKQRVPQSHSLKDTRNSQS